MEKVTVGTVFYVKLGNPFNNENPLRVICQVDGVKEAGAICPEESVRYKGLFLTPNIYGRSLRDKLGFKDWYMPRKAVNKYTIVDGVFWDKANKMLDMLNVAFKCKSKDPEILSGIFKNANRSYREGMYKLMEDIEAWIENNKQPRTAAT